MKAAAASPLARRVALTSRRLAAINGLELALAPERFLLAAEDARALLPPGSPRSGVLALEEAGELWLGLYLDPADAGDSATIVEETSHLVCLAWHAERGRPVSRLQLELQSEVDRYAVARLTGGDALGHFSGFRWDPALAPEARERYRTAHRVAHRYCRALEARYPRRADTPGLLVELRRFYRAAPESRLNAA